MMIAEIGISTKDQIEHFENIILDPLMAVKKYLQDPQISSQLTSYGFLRINT